MDIKFLKVRWKQSHSPVSRWMYYYRLPYLLNSGVKKHRKALQCLLGSHHSQKKSREGANQKSAKFLPQMSGNTLPSHIWLFKHTGWQRKIVLADVYQLHGAMHASNNYKRWFCTSSDPTKQRNNSSVGIVSRAYSHCTALEPEPQFSTWLERIFILLLHTGWVQNPP